MTHPSEKQIRAYRIAEQRLPELVRWDQKALAKELMFLSALDLDFDLDITGFSATEIGLHIASLAHEEVSKKEEDGKAKSFAFSMMQHIVQRMRKKLKLPSTFTLDACRHDGMTELEEVELTDV